MNKTIIKFLLAFIIPISITGQISITKKIKNEINDLVDKRISNETPGLILGIIHNDKLVYQKNYGLANLSYGIANSPKMLYNIGSASKQFVGYAFAMLHEKGKLNLDDPVHKYFKKWPKFKYDVTLRHLLTHSSGYRDAYTISNLAGRIVGVDYLSREDCLNVVRNQKELEFVPGSRHVYNSSTWVILTEILENVTRNLGDSWMEANIFRPLQMNDTKIETYVGEVIYNTAESYTYNEKEKGFVNKKGNRALFGAADVYSNMYDLIKWFKNYHTAELGGEKVNKLFLEPYILKNGYNTHYGLGINVKPFYGLKRYRHIGLHEAFHSDLAYYPEHNLGIITISNFGAIGEVSTSDLAKIILKKYLVEDKDGINTNIPFDEDKFEDFEGLYINTDYNKIIKLRMKEEALFINGVTKLNQVSESIFKIKGLRNLKISLFDDGRIKKIIAEEVNTKRYYIKVDPWNPSTKEIQELLGNYWGDEVGANYEIKLHRKKIIIKNRWLEDIIMYPVCKDFFKLSSGNFVKIIRNKQGKIIGFNLNTRKTFNVFFKRR